VASGKYVQRMSNHCSTCRFAPAWRTGETACPFTTLYWDFLNRHEPLLAKNPGMALQLEHLARIAPAERQAITERAAAARSGDIGPERERRLRRGTARPRPAATPEPHPGMDDCDPLSSPAPLRAPAFEVAGEDGRVRARPGRATDGSLALNLADTDGLVRATLVVEPARQRQVSAAPQRAPFRVSQADAQRRTSAPAAKLRR
jgi:hypothetical protein